MAFPKIDNRYFRKIGYGILIFIIFLILFCIFINSQDLSKLNIKNSSRRKILDKYSDSNIQKNQEQNFMYQQNKKLKNYRQELKQKSKFLDFSNFKQNVKDYKKKLKDQKKNKLNK